mgnify:CR=1 FL=1
MKVNDVLNEAPKGKDSRTFVQKADDAVRTGRITGKGGTVDAFQQKFARIPIDIGPKTRATPVADKTPKKDIKKPVAPQKQAEKPKDEPKAAPTPTPKSDFPISKDGVQLKPGDKVVYKNAKGQTKEAIVKKMLRTKDKQGDLQIGLTLRGADYAIDRQNINQVNGKPWEFDPKTEKGKVETMESILNEGGAMPGVGPIHIDEINPTLDALEKVLGIDLKNNVLGSVGKKEFSGDIDVALDIKTDDIPKFINKLENTPEVMDIAKSSVIMTKVKIVDYDESKETLKPRTGFVQVDFMPGDPGWMKTYYHSPSEKESKYKGVFRNIMIATIAAVLDRKDSEETIDDGRPVESERWLWSPADGLVRVKRTPVPKAKGDGYTKKNKNEIINKPLKTAPEIAKALKLDGPEDLNSYESLKAAIEKNYDAATVDNILDGFAKNKQVQDIGVPDDLKDRLEPKTESLADKQLRRLKELLP